VCASFDITDATTIGYTTQSRQWNQPTLTPRPNEYVASHTVGDTTFSVGYGKVKSGTAYTTVGAEKKLGDNFSMYAGYEMTDVVSGTDTNDMAAGIKFTF